MVVSTSTIYTSHQEDQSMSFSTETEISIRCIHMRALQFDREKSSEKSDIFELGESGLAD